MPEIDAASFEGASFEGASFEGASSGRATLDKRRSEVAAMFDRVATRYDLANDVLSLGQDRAWRRQVVAAAGPRSGQLILDLAAGTGTSSEPFCPVVRESSQPISPSACCWSASAAGPT